MRFECHICGEYLFSKKPQNPELDKGFGVCSKCRDLMVHDMVAYGYKIEDWTHSAAERHLDKYA